MAMVVISGETYPVREGLRALGGRWDPNRKCWEVPAARATEARALVAAGGPKSSNNQPQPYRPKQCKVCGAKEAKNNRGFYTTRIYKSGECSDCYEERKMGY